MPRILLTNDDGVYSEGIKLLASALAELADVIVVAPDREQSASGHSLTLHRPLRMRRMEENWYAVDGTPTDCVNLAVLSLLEDDPPDLVASGINFGSNLGDDVTYSGTVSATCCWGRTTRRSRSWAARSSTRPPPPVSDRPGGSGHPTGSKQPGRRWEPQRRWDRFGGR